MFTEAFVPLGLLFRAQLHREGGIDRNRRPGLVVGPAEDGSRRRLVHLVSRVLSVVSSALFDERQEMQ